MKLLLLSVLAASLACQVSGHAYVYWPTSREALTNSVKGIGVLPHSWNGGQVQRFFKDRFDEKLRSKHGAGEGGAAPGAKKADSWSKNADGCSGLPMTPAPVANYTEGQEIEVVIPVNSEHGGEYEFRLCNKKWDTMSTDKEHLECLDQNLVYRACVNGPGCNCKSDRCRGKIGHTDPKDPIYTKYKNTAPLYGSYTEAGGYLLKMKLPAGVSCEYCTLQWYWFTAWSEEWWGCSDIAIRPSGPTQPTELPPTELPPTPPAPDTHALEKRVAALEDELKTLAPLEADVKMLKAMVARLIAGGGGGGTSPTRRRSAPGSTRRRRRRGGR